MDERLPEIPPSAFAAMGQPCCSKWGKSEIEWIALAYVQALAADGDTWKRLSSKRVWELLTEEQRTSPLYSVLGIDVELSRDFYAHWFNMVADQMADSSGAWGVGGFWNHWRYAKCNADSASEESK